MYVSAADDDDVDGMDKAAVVVGGGGAVHKGERVVPVSWALYAAVVVAAIGSFNFGYFTGIIAGAIIYIDSDFEVSKFWKGALVSCILLGAMAGAAVGGRLASAIGPRAALVAHNLPYIVGAAGMALAPSLAVLLIARTVAGLGVGMSSALVNMYISEVAPDRIRGKLGAVAPFSVTFGILVSYFTSFSCAHLHGPSSLIWRLQLGCGALTAVAQVLLAATLLRSPRWLLQRGRVAEATRVLDRIYAHSKGGASYVAQQVMQLQADLSNANIGGGGGGMHGETHDEKGESLLPVVSGGNHHSEQSQPRAQPQQSAWLQLLSQPQHRHALVIGVGLNALQQLSGVNVVVYFGPTVLLQAGFDKLDSILLTAGVGIAQLVATFVLMQLVDRVGRRPLNFIGLAVMIMSLALLGVSFLPAVHGEPAARWLAVLGMLLFRVSFSLSLGPLPYIITAEVFSTRVRSAGVAVSWATNWVLNFGVSLTFLLLLSLLTPSGTYFFYGAMCIVAVLFVALLVPETAGRNMEEAL